MLLTVHVKPGGRENRLDAVLDDTTVKITLRAPAKEGKANAELVAFFSQCLGIAKSNIEIVRGATTRIKHVNIALESKKTAYELFNS